VPQNSNVPVVTLNSNKNAASKSTITNTPATRTMVKRAAATAANTPKVIWVNDKAAKKNFDGRLYYDIEGKRYWKNYIDGKYYFYNKSMYNNPAFKPR
jgi:hypothetical protein